VLGWPLLQGGGSPSKVVIIGLSAPVGGPIDIQ
jgi:hypothetical protein